MEAGVMQPVEFSGDRSANGRSQGWNESPADKNLPLISVIVPAYNIKNYLGRCINSILGQNYPRIEIILVDDGSNDGTEKIVDQYCSLYPQKIIALHKENGGVTKARLDGVRCAGGKWIGFVDGDDEIEPDMYQRLMDNALKYDTDISHCGYQTIVREGDRIHYFYNTRTCVLQGRTDGIRDLLTGSFVEPGLCNKLYKKELFRNIFDSNTMDLSIRRNEDLLMNFFLFREASRSVFEDFCPYHYLVRDTSESRTSASDERLFDPVKVWKIILSQTGPELEDLAWSRYLSICYRTYGNILYHSEWRDQAEELKMILKNHKKRWGVLSRKEKYKLLAVLYFPAFYHKANSWYIRYFQKKVYE